ncbi:hypothetical protein [Kineosporia sp. A_224]|uniref:hypothetical protein n=1 Tax=Kineosporia sp. A_224 TaxID=1962180 RepID=UPI000B4AC4B3|nr:hypothetical protein [Kineosporia sp. A_224]
MSTRRRISDPVTDAVLRGDGPGLRTQGRPDLAAVADAVAPLRRAAQDGPVQPTPALAALLVHGTRGLVHPTGTAPVTAPHPAAGPTGRHGRRVTAPNRRKRMVWEWLGGLGLAAKLGAASAVAVASVGLTGAAGALPDPVQNDFDKVVATVSPFDGGDDPATGISVEDDATPTDDATPGATPTDDATTPGDGPSTGATPSGDGTTGDATPSGTRSDDADDDSEDSEDSEDSDEAGDDHGGRTHEDDDADDDSDHRSSTSGSRHGSGSSKGDDRSGSGSGSRSDDDADEDRSGSSDDEADEADDENRSGSGGGGADDSSGKDSHEDEPEDD